MRIAYISSLAYSDVEISFLKDAQKIMDITYYILVGPSNRRGCALDLRSANLKEGLNNGTEIDELRRFDCIIDLRKVFVYYSSSTHSYQLKALRSDYMLYKHLKSCCYDVINITFFPHVLSFFWYMLREKIVVTAHDPFPHSSEPYRMDKFNRILSYKLFKHFILLNKSQKKAFVEQNHINQEKVQVYNSYLSCYTYLQMYNDDIKSNDTPYILFFGNIYSYKGLDYLFPAMEIVHKSHPELRLVVAGSGKYYFDITHYQNLEYFDIRNRFIEDKELADLIKGCEFIIAPYVDATQSGVVMSAYAFAKPCIATNVGGLPEMVIDNYNGVVVEPRNIHSLADAIVELLNNKSNLISFSENIKMEYFNGEKSWKYICEDLKGIYTQIMNRNNNVYCK